MANFLNGTRALFYRIIALAVLASLAPVTAPAQEAAHDRIADKVQMILKRTYAAYLPKDLSKEEKWPVLFVLHPGLGDGEYMERTTELHANPLAEKFIIVYPDGYRKTWNAGECCGKAMEKGVRDIKFFERIMEDLAEKTGGRVRQKFFVTGFSNGAIMAYHLACTRPDLVAAIAPFGSSHQFDNCVPGDVAVMHLHGTEDASAPHLGGKSAIKAFNQREQAPAAVTFSRAAARSNCSVDNAREVPVDALQTYCKVMTCGGRTFKLCEIEGLGHVWPGAEKGGGFLGRKFGPARTELDGSQAVLEFFVDHL